MAKRAELRGDYGKSHNDELPDLCSSSNTDRVVKSRKKEMGGKSGTWRGAWGTGIHAGVLVGRCEVKRLL